MLEPIMSTLEKQRVILASSSPRRKDILKQVVGLLKIPVHENKFLSIGVAIADNAGGLLKGLKFEVIPSKYEENLNPEDFATPSDFAITTAVNKVKDVEEYIRNKGEEFDIIIGVDTIVYMNGKVYGKPKNEEDAFKTLKLFSGNCHTVFSGVCIKTPAKMVSFTESTKVYFGNISDEVLKSYVKTGDPMDKAGGYGIQVKGGSFIEKIEGDYFNVVGLPLFRFCQLLSQMFATSE